MIDYFQESCSTLFDIGHNFCLGSLSANEKHLPAEQENSLKGIPIGKDLSDVVWHEKERTDIHTKKDNRHNP